MERKEKIKGVGSAQIREGDTADSRRGNVLATALRTSFGEEGNELRR